MKDGSGFTKQMMHALGDASAGLPHGWTTGHLPTRGSHLCAADTIAGSSSQEDANAFVKFACSQQVPSKIDNITT